MKWWASVSLIADRLKADSRRLVFKAKGTAQPSLIADNILHITTEVEKKNFKWAASSVFGGARFYPFATT
jgi:hypothetical protein